MIVKTELFAFQRNRHCLEALHSRELSIQVMAKWKSYSSGAEVERAEELRVHLYRPSGRK